jgi:predicted aspartyl protease
MVATTASEQGKPVGHTYVDITLTNLFSKKSAEVNALVDTGAFMMSIPTKIATDLGFDLE